MLRRNEIKNYRQRSGLLAVVFIGFQMDPGGAL
jgi:hypothetical protein